MAMNGANILIYSGSVALGSQRDVTFEESNDTIDVSSKGERAKNVLPGRYSSSITCDALYVPSDTVYGLLQDACRDGTLLTIQRYEDSTPDGAVPGTPTLLESASCIVTKLTTKAPDQAEAVISATFEVDGTWS